MKISTKPLIDWGMIIKLIFTKPLNGYELSIPWVRKKSSKSYWLSKSCFSIFIIAKWWEYFNHNKSPIIWIPDYFCNQSLQILRKNNFTIFFYPLRKDLRPDWNACQKLAQKNKPNIFILVHYFGFISDIKNAKIFCNDHGSVFVEDAAHILKPYGEIGNYSDFIFYSPHKFLALPDGALLIQTLNNKLFSNSQFSDYSTAMENIINHFSKKRSFNFPWLIKQIIKKLLPNRIYFTMDSNIDNDFLSLGVKDNFMQSELSRRLLSIQLNSIDRFAKSHQINETILTNLLDIPNNEPFCYLDQIPYLKRIKKETINIEKGEGYEQKWKSFLSIKWPDLPPQVFKNNKYKIANRLYSEYFFLPIHHKLTFLQIKKIASYFNYNSNNNLSYKIKWFDDAEEDWNHLIKSVSNSYLMQSWGYGETKQKIEDWKVKRAVIEENGIAKAFFQVLKKSIGPFNIYRINRGPLIINNIKNPISIYNIYKTINREFQLQKYAILFISPPLENNPQNIAHLISAGFKERNASKWKTSIINLNLPEDILRKNLNGKWRNQLKKSEKFAIDILISNSQKEFHWLMKKYKKMMIDLSFKSVSVEFYDELYNMMQNNFFIFKACINSEPIASVLIIRHGDSCTYQIGWSNPQGRKSHAHNLLLWKAMSIMKDKGCLSFDVGGINEKHTPGIAKFKTGLGGRQYESIGEWRSGFFS